jgi:hypothetical protein
MRLAYIKSHYGLKTDIKRVVENYRQKSESCHYIHIKSFLNVRLTIVSTLLVASPVAAQLEIASLIGGLLGGQVILGF